MRGVRRIFDRLSSGTAFFEDEWCVFGRLSSEMAYLEDECCAFGSLSSETAFFEDERCVFGGLSSETTHFEDERCVSYGLSLELAICEDVRNLWKGRRRSEGASGKKDCCRNVSGPPFFGRAGSRTAAERAGATIPRAGRAQKGCRTCQGRHSSGVQGTERPQNVSGLPYFGWAGIRKAAERARAAILRACREQNSRRMCRDYEMAFYKDGRTEFFGKSGGRERGRKDARGNDAGMCQGRHSLGGQGAEGLQNVPGPPFFGRAGSRTAAECAGTTIFWAGREQKSRRTCQGRHSSGVQGTEKLHNVPGPPFFGCAGTRTAAERARTAILWAGREQKSRRPCQGRHTSGGQGAEGLQNVPGPPFFGRAGSGCVAGRRNVRGDGLPVLRPIGR